MGQRDTEELKEITRRILREIRGDRDLLKSLLGESTQPPSQRGIKKKVSNTRARVENSDKEELERWRKLAGISNE